MAAGSRDAQGGDDPAQRERAQRMAATPPPPGSPAWWAARPDPTAPAAAAEPRRGRPSLDTAHIVGTALRLVDEHGTQAFSLRMLAEALNSGTATLYRHFDGKDEIMAYVVDRVLGEVNLGALTTSSDWREALTVTAHGFHDALRRHPNTLPLLMAYVPVGPHGLAQRERVLAALLEHGLPAALAARAFTAVAHYVVGFTAQQYGPAAAPDHSTEVAAFYGGLDPESYPALLQAARSLTSVAVDEEFEFGLTLLVRGLAHLAP
ncbi:MULTISPECIES: TetR/AcrR family transcriptional regulator [unclassified Streptomyces]|uniref:TetR/AcrR family transcriptional regulator n=1 Tax=unclassified Streptomyces TaxID=2593676 RepID=UPI001E382F41|nr:TetR/AcrR family transcriptional regulator [Streptomyces sp. CB02980]MCB8901599.1 TetR/AcrR family transcriptional regulator [Streptomyces sp. CB02980]